jgi:23S rRNA pseudouridine2605 synthase
MGPVGRLDMDSEGLLLMTNDTEWANRITAPDSHLEKTYHVQLDRAVDLKKFETGIADGGDFLTAKRANLLKNGWLEIVLDEGKNRQIRRMAEAAGAEVLQLLRVKIGNLALGDLPAGAARELTPEDIKLLL